MHPNWVLDKLQNFSNFAIFEFFNIHPKPNLDASAGLETCSNRFFALENPHLHVHFVKNKNSIFRHFSWFSAQKKVLPNWVWEYKPVHHVLIAHRTSSEIFIPIELCLHGFPGKIPQKWPKMIKNSFLSRAEKSIFLDSLLRWRLATWNGGEHFHFSSKGTLSRQKLQPQMPGRYQTINNEGLKKPFLATLENFKPIFETWS